MANIGIWNTCFKGSLSNPNFRANMRSKTHLSTINTNGVSTIAPSVTNAILAIAEGRVSAGKIGKAFYCECKSGKTGSDKRYAVKYDPSVMKIDAFVAEGGSQISQELATDTYSHWAVFVPRVVELIAQDPNGEFALNYQDLVKEFKATGIISKQCEHQMFVLNDYLYTTNLDYVQKTSDISTISMQNLVLDEDITNLIGFSADFEFGLLPSTSAANVAAAPKTKRSGKAAASKPTGGKFLLEWDRDLTDEEKALIPKFDLTVMKMHKRVEKMIHMVKEESQTGFPVNNIILYGEGGAGKSTAAKLAAQLWGLPYRFINLSLNSEESDIVGSYRPKADGTFEFFEPAFAQTFRNGGVIEIMEINYARPGALGAINSGLDDTAQITLGNGEVIKRHPNCIIVATTNVDYAGCQKMNEALKDRFQQLILVEKLSNNDLVEIAMRQSGNNNQTLVAKMVDAVQKISIKMVEEQISGGVCSTRQLINWARDVKYTNNPIESAKDTILPGVALDLELQKEIVDTILKPMF